MSYEVCDECETVQHCMNNGCIPKVPPKPVVYYLGEVKFWNWNDDVRYPVASIPVVLDHPRLGTCYNVRTSVVVHKNANGIIETLNTIYKPMSLEMMGS